MSLRVLVVDDETAIRELLAEYLQGRGLDVSTAPDGERAAARIAEDPPDVVLSDLKLPGIDGIDVVRAACGNVPCVLMTGFGTVETAVEAFGNGAAGYVLKPFRLRDVYTQIVRAHTAATKRRSQEWAASAMALIGAAELAHAPEAALALVPTLITLLRQLPGGGGSVCGEPTTNARPLGNTHWISDIPDTPEARGLVRAVHTALVRAGR